MIEKFFYTMNKALFSYLEYISNTSSILFLLSDHSALLSLHTNNLHGMPCFEMKYVYNSCVKK